MAPRLNFSIHPHYLPLTPPPNPPNQSLTTNRSSSLGRGQPTPITARTVVPSPSIIIAEPRQEDAEINSHQAAAICAKEIADRAGAASQYINQMLLDLDNPTIPQSEFIQKLQRHVDSEVLIAIYKKVALTLRGERNGTVQVGLDLLTNHFRVILRIKDSDGFNLLEQTANFYLKKQALHRGLSDLNKLFCQLKTLQTLTRRTTSSPIQNTQLLVECADLKRAAINAFQNLPSIAMKALCQNIWSLDGEPRQLNYAYDVVIQDIEKILNHKNTCPLDTAILECKGQEKRISLNVSYLHELEIPINASPKDLIQSIRAVYHLEDLQRFLNDPHKNNDFLCKKYQNLQPVLYTLINQIVWRACYRPNIPKFAENYIKNNVHSLLNFKNQEGVDLISQLLSHYREKITCYSIIKDLEIFRRNIFNNQNQRPLPDPQQFLAQFNNLSEKTKEGLRYRIWYRDGGSTDPHFGGKNYGTHKIERDPLSLLQGFQCSLIDSYLAELERNILNVDLRMLKNLSETKTLPNEPIDVSSSALTREEGLIENLPTHLRVAFVATELSGVASFGGLGSAVEGMVKGFGTKNSCVVLPLYENGPIAQDKLQLMREKLEYQIELNRKTYKIFKAKINGINCYFVKDSESFSIPKKEGGATGNFYNGEHYEVKRRFTVFQSIAAELVYKLSKKHTPFNLVHCHDAQTALIPKFLATRYPQEWREGRTPTTVFTFHNNLESSPYDDETSQEILRQHGLPKKGTNSFIAALEDSEIVTTVSDTFGKEAQTTLFGKGLETFTKKAAFEGKLFGIVNGNSNGFDPRKDEVLQNWRTIEGNSLDLRFGPDSVDLADKLKTIQRELCTHLRNRTDDAYADLDPEKPIVFYVGRYDYSQKGVDKFEFIMEESLRNGAQFVCAGVCVTDEPNDPAKEVLNRMKERARELNHKGVLIIEDKKADGKLIYQGVFGSLLRAASSLPIFPSEYEPCGLVQGELNRFGKKVVTTRTGGFVDTLNETNGYLFPRLADWHSEEQNEAIAQTLQIAINEAKAFQQALYTDTADEQLNQMRTIMRNALNSTWEKTPDSSLSPIRRLELVYAKAFSRRPNRGKIITPLQTLKI